VIVGRWEIPPAEGDPSPAWPLASGRRVVRSTFGQARADGERVHVGEDLRAEPGTLVLAPESGSIANVHAFTSQASGYRASTEVLLLRGDSGLTLALGEIEPGSWSLFGMSAGSRVRKGDPVGRVGGLGMLHVEAYASASRMATSPWRRGDAPPPDLRDPAPYLARAADGTPALAAWAPAPPIPREDGPQPAPRATARGGSPGWGLAGIVLLVLAYALLRGPR
jgi:murein DD-endopeptidase MepM/ murein hydrolase activator NlpD